MILLYICLASHAGYVRPMGRDNRQVVVSEVMVSDVTKPSVRVELKAMGLMALRRAVIMRKPGLQDATETDWPMKLRRRGIPGLAE